MPVYFLAIVAFLLVYAIAIVVPWTTDDSAREDVYTESRALAEAYWAVSALPPPEGQRTQEDLRAHTASVVGDEWRLVKKGRLSQKGQIPLRTPWSVGRWARPHREALTYILTVR